jgi:hypothetical protein
MARYTIQILQLKRLCGCDKYVDLLTHHVALIIVYEFQNFTLVWQLKR